MRIIPFVLLAAISFSFNMTYINDYYIKGTWTDYVATPKGVLRMEENTVTIDFKNDTFYYSNGRSTDYFLGDTCQVDRGDEYASGKYSIDDSLLYLDGYWTDASYKNVKNTGCYNNGKMNVVYKLQIIDKKTINLSLADTALNFRTGIKKSLILRKN